MSKSSNSQKTTYLGLLDQPADFQAYAQNKLVAETPLVFHNCLPVYIDIMCESNFGSHTFFVGRMEPLGKISYEPRDSNSIVSDGDLVIFLSEGSIVCPSHRVAKRHGSIIVGGTIAHTGTYKRDWHPGSDVSSINIHNMLPWDVMIEVNLGNLNMGVDRPKILIERNEDLNSSVNHANMTVAPNVHYNNKGFGMNLGTLFHVKAKIGSRSQYTTLYTFALSDISETNIFLGAVSVKIDQHPSTGTSHPQKNTGTSIYRMSERINPITHSVSERISPISQPVNSIPSPFETEYPPKMTATTSPNLPPEVRVRIPPIIVRVPLDRTGGAPLMGKRFPGNDHHRSALHATHGYNTRSTNPTARYKQLSGGNSIRGIDMILTDNLK